MGEEAADRGREAALAPPPPATANGRDNVDPLTGLYAAAEECRGLPLTRLQGALDRVVEAWGIELSVGTAGELNHLRAENEQLKAKIAKLQKAADVSDKSSAAPAVKPLWPGDPLVWEITRRTHNTTANGGAA